MQTGGRRRHRALLAREDGLVVLRITFIRPARALYIRRQGQHAVPLQRRHQLIIRDRETQHDLARVAFLDTFRLKVVRDMKHVARLELARRAGKRGPAVQPFPLVQGNLDPGLATPAPQARGDDARIVDHQNVPGAQKPGEIAHMRVNQPSTPTSRRRAASRGSTGRCAIAERGSSKSNRSTFIGGANSGMATPTRHGTAHHSAGAGYLQCVAGNGAVQAARFRK